MTQTTTYDLRKTVFFGTLKYIKKNHVEFNYKFTHLLMQLVFLKFVVLSVYNSNGLTGDIPIL